MDLHSRFSRWQVLQGWQGGRNAAGLVWRGQDEAAARAAWCKASREGRVGASFSTCKGRVTAQHTMEPFAAQSSCVHELESERLYLSVRGVLCGGACGAAGAGAGGLRCVARGVIKACAEN